MSGATPHLPFPSCLQLLPFSFIFQITEASERLDLDQLAQCLYALAIILVRSPKGRSFLPFPPSSHHPHLQASSAAHFPASHSQVLLPIPICLLCLLLFLLCSRSSPILLLISVSPDLCSCSYLSGSGSKSTTNVQTFGARLRPSGN